MGSQPPPQENLFYAGFSLDSRVRKDHPLRDVARTVDFNFICGQVAQMYGHNGNVSVPPPVILKLMFLLVTYNVRSERELMLATPERLDWLWFLGYTLDSDIPNHSVLSKARPLADGDPGIHDSGCSEYRHIVASRSQTSPGIGVSGRTGAMVARESRKWSSQHASGRRSVGL